MLTTTRCRSASRTATTIITCRPSSAKFGVVYSRAGNGICHQVHLERFGKPGTTLLGADSHTPTGGGIGQIAIGAGGLDVAVAMGGGPFLSRPARGSTWCDSRGKLRDWVSAKDIVLKMLSILTTKGNVGVVLEYGGEGRAGPLRARARHNRQHGRRDGGNHLHLPLGRSSRRF